MRDDWRGVVVVVVVVVGRRGVVSGVSERGWSVK